MMGFRVGMETNTVKLTISKLATPVRCGDWHDRPLKWEVNGAEKQLFATKKDALLWAKIRRHSASFLETFDKFVATV